LRRSVSTNRQIPAANYWSSFKSCLPCDAKRLRLVAFAFCSWIAAVEAGTEAWYRFHERRLPAPIVWHAQLPREQSDFRELPFPEATRRVLRFDEGINAIWSTGGGLRCQAIFLRWEAGGTAVHLARNHTPEDCLISSGHELVNQSPLRVIPVHGLHMPFR